MITRRRGLSRRLLDVDTPASTDGLDVEAFTEDADFAPGVPVRWNDDLLSINDVMSKCIAFEERVDAKRGLDKKRERVGRGI